MTLYLSNRDGNGKTSEEGHYRLQTQILSGDTLGTSLQVIQNSPTGMSVLVSPGDFKIATTNYSYTGWNTVNTAVTITTADPANPRITTIVAFVDKAASTSASPPNNPGIIKLMAVNGTAAPVPAAPNGAAIQSAVGSGNPYIILADVLVGAAVSTIVTANITDRRTPLQTAPDLVRTTSILDSAVTANKLATNAVTTTKITDLNVTTAKLANNAVTAAKIEAQEAWIQPTLSNGWVQYDIASYPPLCYFKDSLGIVHFKGLVKSGTIGATFFTLPVGYRPLKQLHIVTVSNGAFANIAVQPGGIVASQNGSNAWFSLDGISFRAEQ